MTLSIGGKPFNEKTDDLTVVHERLDIKCDFWEKLANITRETGESLNEKSTRGSIEKKRIVLDTFRTKLKSMEPFSSFSDDIRYGYLRLLNLANSESDENLAQVDFAIVADKMMENVRSIKSVMKVFLNDQLTSEIEMENFFPARDLKKMIKNESTPHKVLWAEGASKEFLEKLKAVEPPETLILQKQFEIIEDEMMKKKLEISQHDRTKKEHINSKGKPKDRWKVKKDHLDKELKNLSCEKGRIKAKIDCLNIIARD